MAVSLGPAGVILDNLTIPNEARNNVVNYSHVIAQNPGSAVSVTSTSYQDIFTVNYTPVISGSNLVIISYLGMYGDVDNDTQETTQVQIKCLRDSTEVFQSGTSILSRGGHSRFAVNPVVINFTTSSTTQFGIKWQMRRSSGNRTALMGGMIGSRLVFVESVT